MSFPVPALDAVRSTEPSPSVSVEPSHSTFWLNTEATVDTTPSGDVWPVDAYGQPANPAAASDPGMDEKSGAKSATSTQTLSWSFVLWSMSKNEM